MDAYTAGLPCNNGSAQEFGQGKFDAESLNTLKSTVVGAAFLSVGGSLFVIATCHLTRNHKPLILSLLYWLSISDLISSLTYIVDGLSIKTELHACETNLVCTLSATVLQASSLAAILWTGSIALNLHFGLVLQSKISRLPHVLLRRLHIGIWSTSVGGSLLLALVGAYGVAGQWCWIPERSSWARLVCYYMPLLVVLVYNAVVYALTRRTLLAMQIAAKATSAEISGAIELTSHNALQGLAGRMRLLLVIYILVHTSSILNRLHDFVFPEQPSYMLSLLQSLSAPMQGLGNAIVYGVGSSRVRQVWGCKTRCWPLQTTSKTQMPAEVVAETILEDFGTASEESRRISAQTCKT